MVQAIEQRTRSGATLDEPRLVLLAEDDELVSKVLADMLVRLGFRVVRASNGREAMAAFVRHLKDISLILVDDLMPESRGLDVIPRMRRMKDDIPIILTSGGDQRSALDASTGCSPDAFLQKPFSPETLESVIGQVLTA